MKKIFAIVLCMVMVFACVTSASAISWGKVENTTAACEKYNVSLFKFEKVSGINGDIYRIVSTATAKVGDTVYFGGYAIGESSINATFYAFNAEDFKLIDLVNIRKVTTTDFDVDDLGGVSLPIYSAQVVGATPTVNITLKSGDDVTELTYKGKQIVTSDTATEVVLGNFGFIRDAATGIVSAVRYWDGTNVWNVNKKELSAESYETLVKELAVLGVTMEDVEAGRVCMSNINLIKNFGNYCETVKGVCWGEQCVITPNVSLTIPKTGDASVGMYIGVAFIVLAIAGGAWYIVSKRGEAAN